MARIFIIGDNLLIRTLLREVLDDAGHQVIGDAVTGPAAMSTVLELRPDLVVLDVVLLRSAELATLRELVTIDRQLAVIVCAALLERAKAIAALQIGASGFIVKPFDRGTVLESVERTLSHIGEAASAAELQSTAVQSAQPAGAANEQRGFTRVPAAVPVVLQAPDGQRLETHTVDLSGGGMLLEDGSLPVGAIVHFQLELGPEEPPVPGHARVVRITEDGHLALAFEEVSVADHERLIDHIAHREGSSEARFTGP